MKISQASHHFICKYSSIYLLTDKKACLFLYLTDLWDYSNDCFYTHSFLPLDYKRHVSETLSVLSWLYTWYREGAREMKCKGRNSKREYRKPFATWEPAIMHSPLLVTIPRISLQSQFLLIYKVLALPQLQGQGTRFGSDKGKQCNLLANEIGLVDEHMTRLKAMCCLEPLWAAERESSTLSYCRWT